MNNTTAFEALLTDRGLPAQTISLYADILNTKDRGLSEQILLARHVSAIEGYIRMTDPRFNPYDALAQEALWGSVTINSPTPGLAELPHACLEVVFSDLSDETWVPARTPNIRKLVDTLTNLNLVDSDAIIAAEVSNAITNTVDMLQQALDEDDITDEAMLISETLHAWVSDFAPALIGYTRALAEVTPGIDYADDLTYAANDLEQVLFPRA